MPAQGRLLLSMKSERSTLPTWISLCFGTRMRPQKSSSRTGEGFRGTSSSSSSGSSFFLSASRFSFASLRICRSSDGVTASWSWTLAPFGAVALPGFFSMSSFTDIGIGKPPLQGIRCMSFQSFITSSWPCRNFELRPSQAVSTSIFRMFGFCTACPKVPLLTAKSHVMQYVSLESRSGRGGARLYGRLTLRPSPFAAGTKLRSSSWSLCTMLMKHFCSWPFLKRMAVFTQQPGLARRSDWPSGISPLASSCCRYCRYSFRCAGSEISLTYSSMCSLNLSSFIAFVSLLISSIETPLRSFCM
mmetsp:Transcript_71718/g.184991  ORF Transcript_71718/g.184991 Transcript_71718/m.184991 type:complete len:302 (+) Transcript_71718:815-1720(+)